MQLNVNEVLGPYLLQQFPHLGPDLERVVRTWRWNRAAISAENEAITLARIMHFHLLIQNHTIEAFTNGPWMEIALRSLSALLRVEELVVKHHVDRPAAWISLEAYLEVQSTQYMRTAAIDSHMMQDTNGQVKFMNSLRGLSTRRENARWAHAEHPRPVLRRD